MAAKQTFKVRAFKRGFGGVPAARRAVNEVFRVEADTHGKLPKSGWFRPVKESVAEGKPEPQAQTQAQQFEKREGDIVPVDRRNSADAFTAAEQPDTSYLDKVPALQAGDGEAGEASDSGDDLT